MNLLMVEMRRALTRRVVRVMILIALLACVLAGVIAFTSSSGRSLAQLGALHPAVLTDWWVVEQSDGAVFISSFFLLLGTLFTGAAVAGGEWRAGTVVTVLTWEPRRVRLHLARTAACGILALVIGFLLEVVFLASFLPAVFAHGSTAGATVGWWTSLGLAMGRAALLASLAAMLAAALATLGRNTAFALGAVFGWIVVVEGLIRGLRPGWAAYLWGENIGTILPWRQMADASFTRGPLLALMTVLGYTAVAVVAATIVFRRRDLASTS